MVRQVIFDDGLRWVARVPMPRRIVGRDREVTIESKDAYFTNECTKSMESQIYTSMYIREHSDIPVPEIFGFALTSNNPFKAPDMFMECIMGNCIMDIAHDVPEEST